MILSGMNTMEAVPQVLSWTARGVIKTMLDDSTRGSIEALGIPVDPDLEFIHIHDGRAYAIAESMATTMLRIPGFKWEGAGVDPKVVWSYLPKEITKPLSIRDRIQGVILAVGIANRMSKVLEALSVRSLSKNIDLTREWDKRVSEATLAQELAEMSEPLTECLIHLGTVHILSALLFIPSWTFLEQACRRAGVPPSLVVANSGGIISSRMTSMLYQLAAEAAKLEIDLDADDAWDKLDADPTIQQLLQAFMETCGHRGFNELELSTPKFREDPGAILSAMRAQATTNPRDMAEHASQTGWAQVPKFWRKLVEQRVEDAQRKSAIRELTKDVLLRITDVIRQWCLKAAATMPDPQEVWLMSMDEITLWLRDGTAVDHETLEKRKADLETWRALPPVETVYIDDVTGHAQALGVSKEQIQAKEINGMVASRGVHGKVKGRAIVTLDHRVAVEKIRELREAGEPTPLLITRVTNVAWTVTFGAITGIITEVGGMASHAAIVAREYGIPALVGVPGVVASIPDGAKVELDCELGVVRWQD